MKPLSDQFALVWENDPALDRDRIEAAHGADETQPDFATAYMQAVQTLDWSRLCREGESPTLYHFRPITGMELLALIDMQCGDLTKGALAFRMALRKVDGVDKIERGPDRRYPDLGPMVTAQCFDRLCESGDATKTMRAVHLGTLVFHRSTTLNPL